MFLRHLRLQCSGQLCFPPGREKLPPTSACRPRLPPSPRWVLAPAPPWQCPGLRRREQLPLTPRSQPKFVKVGNAGGKPRGPLGRPSADAVREASVSLWVQRADGVGLARAARAGREECGPGRAPAGSGPAGPRTRRLSPRAGCCGLLGSAGAAARLARCGPWGS